MESIKKQNKLIIEIPFLFYAVKRFRKTMPDVLVKINNQAIYSGTLNKHERNTAVRYVKDHLGTNMIKNKVNDLNIKKVRHTVYKLYVVRNHGNIRLLQGSLNWKKPAKDYVINWDVDNLAFFWIKTDNDALVENKVLMEDTADRLNMTTYLVEFVENLEDCKIQIMLIDYE